MPIQYISTILGAAEAAQSLFGIVSNYMQFVEREQTRQCEIAAWERTTYLGGVAAVALSGIEYMKIVQQEQTKRREIEAWEKETIARINAQRDVLIEYLDRSFDERAENFRALFKVVDRAITTGNNEQLAVALHSITEIAKSSPFKELANLSSVRAALDDPSHEWTF